MQRWRGTKLERFTHRDPARCAYMRVRSTRGLVLKYRGVNISNRDGVDKPLESTHFRIMCLKKHSILKGGKEAIDHCVVNSTDRRWLVFSEFSR